MLDHQPGWLIREFKDIGFMKDENKSKAQLIHELEGMRRRIAKYESVEGRHKPAESGKDALRKSIFSPEDDTGDETHAERDTLRNSLQVAEGKYRGIFENAIEGIYRSTPDGRLIEINPAFTRILGYNSPEAVKNRVKDIGQKFYVDPGKRREWISQLAERDYGRFEVQLRRKDGSTRWISNKARVVRNERGETLYFDGFVEDITEKRRAEEELKKAEEKYRSIFENAIEGIYRTTPDGRFLDANPALAHIFGYDSPEEMMNTVTNVGNQLHLSPESRKRFISIMDQQDYDDFEAQMCKKDGSTCWVCFRGRSVRDAEGKTLYYEGLAEDITERKRTEEVLKQYRDHLEELVEKRTYQLEERNRQLNSEIAERKEAERALAESEALYRNLFENASIGMFQTSLEGRFLRINKAYAAMLGYESPEEVIMTITDAATQLHADPGNRAELLAALGEQGWFYAEQPYLRKDGSIMFGKISVRKVERQGGTTAYLEGIVEDITERRKKEEALIRSEKELRIKAQNLMEVNTTLKVLLNTMEKDQQELQERFLSNIKSQVLPYLERLRKRPLQDVEQGFLQMAEANLNEIASPLVQKLKSSYLNLTKTELQIAALVKEGKTSKEIANLLNAKKRVIEFHRQNIRRKLGLSDKKGSLAILLRSFS